MKKRIAIIGGGPGGLTLARLLQVKGIDCTVYERDLNRTVRVQGATLDLHEDSGLKALQEGGLMEAFKANYRPGADKTLIMDKYATILLDEHVNEKEEFFRPEIDRGPLRDILLDSLKPGTVAWNSCLESLDKTEDHWILRFRDGTMASADLVIAADGANSKVRPYITPIRPFYTGYTAVEGAVYHAETAAPRIHRLLSGGKIFALSDEKTLIVGAKGDGSLAFYLGFAAPEDWYHRSNIDFNDNKQVLAWFQETFTGWDPIWYELFENAEPHFIPRPQFCIPPDQYWEALPDLTMLGDAAHLMPPYAGEGVNMAMLDALELSRCLSSAEFPDTLAAIAAYERHMRTRSGAIATMTLEQTASLHSVNAIAGMMALFA